MAIAYDISADSGVNNNIWDHTVASGAGLFVFFTEFNTAVDATCTYNGTAMTLISSSTDGAAGVFVSYVFYLSNPTSGTHSVEVTQVGGIYPHGFSITYTGIRSTQPDSKTEQVITTSPTTVNTTVVASNCWLVGFGVMSQHTVPTATRTTRQSGTMADFPVNQGGMILCDSNGTVATGSQGVTFTQSSATNGIGIVISIKEPSASPVTNASFLFNMI